MKRTIIIPAAGRAVRFGGIAKELLPVAEGVSCLQRIVAQARLIGEPLVVTNPVKRALHESLLPGVPLVVQGPDDPPELLGAMQIGIRAAGPGPAGLMMADTVVQFDEGHIPEAKDLRGLWLGLFSTMNPERFSVMGAGDRIVTKAPGRAPAKAWGMLVWSAEVGEMLAASTADHYDKALNEAVARHKWSFFDLRSYHDLGTMAAYRHFLMTTLAL